MVNTTCFLILLLLDGCDNLIVCSKKAGKGRNLIDIYRAVHFQQGLEMFSPSFQYIHPVFKKMLPVCSFASNSNIMRGAYQLADLTLELYEPVCI